MSDLKEQFGISFQEDGSHRMEEIELVDEVKAKEESEEEEKAPSFKPEEIEEFKKRADSNDAYKESLRLISEKLEKVGGTSNIPPTANVMPQQPYESDEQYSKRIEEEVWKSGSTLRIMREVIGREVAPEFHALRNITVQQEKKLLGLDPEKGQYFKRYSKDIDEVVSGLPPQQRVTPGVYEWAYDKVMSTKQGDIIEERVNSKVEELVKKKLEEMGISSGEPKVKGNFSEVGSASSGVPSSKKRRVTFSAEDQRRATEKGLDLEDYLRGIGKL